MMKFDKMNFALAAGFTGLIVSFVLRLLMSGMYWGGLMHMRGGMMGFGRAMESAPLMQGYSASAMSTSGCPMGSWGIIVGPIVIFFIAAAAGWIFAFLYNKMTNQK